MIPLESGLWKQRFPASLFQKSMCRKKNKNLEMFPSNSVPSLQFLTPLQPILNFKYVTLHIRLQNTHKSRSLIKLYTAI